MSVGTVFINNRTQAVRLPVDVRPPEGVHKVEIRIRGVDTLPFPGMYGGGHPDAVDG